MSKRRKQIGVTNFADTAYLNNTTYMFYYNWLKNIAINRFKWTGLNDAIDVRWVELNLFERGYILYFNDPYIGDLMLPCTIGGKLNVNNIPMERRAFASNGYNQVRYMDDSVLMYSNYLRAPDEPVIRMFAYRLYCSTRARDVNINQQKFPYLMLMPESKRLSYENLIMKYEGNSHLILLDKDWKLDEMQTFPTSVPYVANNLTIETRQILNEALSYLGVENGNVDKKERLQENEVTANYGLIEASRSVWLNARQDACREINEMFGTNISVEFNSNMYTKLNKPDDLYRLQLGKVKGGNEDESIYDASPMDSGIPDSGLSGIPKE